MYIETRTFPPHWTKLNESIFFVKEATSVQSPLHIRKIAALVLTQEKICFLSKLAKKKAKRSKRITDKHSTGCSPVYTLSRCLLHFYMHISFHTEVSSPIFPRQANTSHQVHSELIPLLISSLDTYLNGSQENQHKTRTENLPYKQPRCRK
mmetsp:Transcript_23491/g.65207  ORF Transcript_23491/g.65207 Transcript_23491/m.65207 type:complete len:151 (+) Transcript_23491:2522-2974(+)